MHGFLVRSASILVLLSLLLTAPVSLAQEPDAGPPTIEALLEAIPSDTPVFAAGELDGRMAPFFDTWAMPVTDSDLADIRDLLADADSPAVDFLLWVLQDYSKAMNGGYAAVMERYGLAPAGVSAFYLDGALPVLRYSVADEAAFTQFLDEASKATGVNSLTMTLDAGPLYRWPFVAQAEEPGRGDEPPEPARSLDLLASIADGLATFTIATPMDSADTIAARMSLTKLEDSMANAGTWTALGETYGFDPATRLYIDFAALVDGVFNADDSAFGRDLKRLLPQLPAAANEAVDAKCQSEVRALVGQAPRLVAGIESIEVSDSALNQSLRLIWEFTNAKVIEQLTRLPGSLPNYSTSASDKLMALGIGIDVGQLTPAATALWQQFTGAEFECDALVQAQEQMGQMNPAMLAGVTAMAQGVKGLAVALYSLEADPTSPLGVAGSLLVSLSTENPQTLVALLTSTIPGLAGLNIPADGEPVRVPLPPPVPPTFAAIKGQHLVAYTGADPEIIAANLAEEPLNSRGTSAFAFNYARFGTAFIEAASASPLAQGLSEMSTTGDCTDAYVSLLQLAELPMALSYVDTYTTRGWEAELAFELGRAEGNGQTVDPGTYDVALTEPDCTWSTIGTETLNADGTGRYTEGSDDGSCDLYQLEYRWDQDGRQITQLTAAERTRDDCDMEWSAMDPETYRCTLLHFTDSGFYCLYTYEDDEPTLMRYARK